MNKLVNRVLWIENSLWVVKEQWEGTENLSYHGSASYETFIKCENIESKEIKTFGSESTKWNIAEDYIKWLERYRETVRNKVKKLYDIV